MSHEQETVPADIAEWLFESTDGEEHQGWTRLGDQLRRTARWEEHRWLVVGRDGEPYGVPYSVGLTEMQENSLPWEERPGSPIRLTPLLSEQQVVTRYRQVTP